MGKQTIKKMLLKETQSGEGLVDEDSEFESSLQVNTTLIGWLIKIDFIFCNLTADSFYNLGLILMSQC